ncbi:MAG: 4Fe-4S binding protein [Spirochaetes bacterium]|nr:4Fe-4S binding protein [Spirochaetota bacterium]
MMRTVKARLRQGYRTNRFPKENPKLSSRYTGLPALDSGACTACGACEEVCPTEAISTSLAPLGFTLDLGRCIFCGACENACGQGAIAFSGNFRMGATDRKGLVLGGDTSMRIERLREEMLRCFGHAMKIRVVSAGGCGACEADVNVLETIGFDLSRFGISITASPRHSDALVVTGPVSGNMELALKKTWDAMPEPKFVIAVGACAISGGIYRGMPEVRDGAGSTLPVALFIPGCPPHPLSILNALLSLLDRMPNGRGA